jgi:hypothetical protein
MALKSMVGVGVGVGSGVSVGLGVGVAVGNAGSWIRGKYDWAG